MSNFYQLCARFPPPLVRLLARKDGRAMTSKEIVAATGFHIFTVEALFSYDNWDQVPTADMKVMLVACGLDFTSRADMNRVETYLRKNNGHPTFKYLTTAENWPTYYLPLIVSWRKSMTTIPNELPEPIRQLLKGIKV